MIKSALNYSFGGNGYPQLFMTDCATAEINALKNTWPESKNLFCIFHVCQAVWKWCWDSKHQIPKEERVVLMRSFKKIVNANSKLSVKEAFVKAISSSIHDDWKKYLQGFWDNCEKWCLAWRDITCKGYHTNNFSEITVRIFKDTLNKINEINRECITQQEDH